MLQPCEVRVSSSESAPAARSACVPDAPTSAAGPPCRTVSAAVIVRTRSVSTSAGLTRSGTPAVSPRSTRPGSSASWMTTVPWKLRANPGETMPSRSRSRRAGLRISPLATSSVWRSTGTPARASSTEAAESAASRGSCCAPGSGSEGGSTTIVARPPRGASAASGWPASGKRSASRRATATSAIGSPGGGGRSTTASSGASTTTTRLPERSGSRVTGLGNRPVEPEEARAEAAPGPEARGEQVRDTPVGQHHPVALLGRPGEAGLRERDADPAAAGLGNRRGEAQGARVLGAGEAPVLGRALGWDE